MRRPALWHPLAFCLVATMANAAHAQDASGLQVASLAATCAACHGTDGHAARGAVIPGLAAMRAATLREQMLAFKNDVRPGTVMPQIAKGYSDAQIERLAAYFAGRSSRVAP